MNSIQANSRQHLNFQNDFFLFFFILDDQMTPPIYGLSNILELYCNRFLIASFKQNLNFKIQIYWPETA